LKKLLLTLSLAVACLATYAQNTYPWSSTGNVGIGTTSPGTNLGFLNVDVDLGNSGITWYNPDPLDYGIYKTTGSWSSPNFQQLKLQFLTGIVLNPGTSYGKSYVEITGGGLRVTSGSVGINTTYIPSGYQLAINGSEIATSVTVQLNSSWPDYVFKSTYKLMPLNELKKFVYSYNHLPDFPSENDIKTNGLNLGESDKLLTKKVEELTLYLIEKDSQLNDEKDIIIKQQHQIDTQQQVNNQQDQQLQAQQKQINLLIKELSHIIKKKKN
jgi:hypothetical protein